MDIEHANLRDFVVVVVVVVGNLLNIWIFVLISNKKYDFGELRTSKKTSVIVTNSLIDIDSHKKFYQFLSHGPLFSIKIHLSYACIYVFCLLTLHFISFQKIRQMYYFLLWIN